MSEIHITRSITLHCTRNGAGEADELLVIDGQANIVLSSDCPEVVEGGFLLLVGDADLVVQVLEALAARVLHRRHGRRLRFGRDEVGLRSRVLRDLLSIVVDALHL